MTLPRYKESAHTHACCCEQPADASDSRRFVAKERQSDRSSSNAALKPVVRRPPAPRALTGMFDPSKIGQRQNASSRVVAWAKDLLPDTVEASA